MTSIVVNKTNILAHIQELSAWDSVTFVYYIFLLIKCILRETFNLYALLFKQAHTYFIHHSVETIPES